MRTNLNKKRSRNENHGEMSLTSTSTVEHNPMNVLNVVKVKLQSTMQIEEEDDTRRSRAGQEMDRIEVRSTLSNKGCGIETWEK